MAHAVERHPQKDYIVNSLLAGVPIRKIAATIQPTIHYTTINQYRMTVIRPAIKNATILARVSGIDKTMPSEQLAGVVLQETTKSLQAAPIVDPYLARIAQHAATIDRNLVNAEADGDGRTVAALVGVDLKGLELDARLTGRLDTVGATTTTIYVMTPQAAVTIGGSGPVVDVTPEPRAIRTNESDSKAE